MTSCPILDVIHIHHGYCGTGSLSAFTVKGTMIYIIFMHTIRRRIHEEEEYVTMVFAYVNYVRYLSPFYAQMTHPI